jgi:hypothetical protein
MLLYICGIEWYKMQLVCLTRIDMICSIVWQDLVWFDNIEACSNFYIHIKQFILFVIILYHLTHFWLGLMSWCFLIKSFLGCSHNSDDLHAVSGTEWEHVFRRLIQYWTVKGDKFCSAINRFFWGNQVLGSFSGRLKMSKTSLAGLFPRFLGLNDFWDQNFTL